MSNKNIPAIFKYGIEIVKPWSKEMYDFNDNITAIMCKEIEFSINALEDEDTANKLAKIINPYGYGEGFDLTAMKQDMLNNVEGFENYWYAQIWDELIDADFVQPIFDEEGNSYNVIGFESPSEIKKLRELFA